MKSRILIAAVAAFGFVAPSPASASAADWGTISAFLSMSSYGVVLFNQSGTRSSPPSCGAGLGLRWAINTSTAGGQSALSTLLYAYAMHKRVYIQGTGDCSVWGDTETVLYLVVED